MTVVWSLICSVLSTFYTDDNVDSIFSLVRERRSTCVRAALSMRCLESHGMVLLIVREWVAQ